MALRKDLGPYQSYIDDLELVDYKVRILTGGTDAVTRVLIESRDGEGRRWFTVGVSPNIVDASFEALLEFNQLQADPRRRACALMQETRAWWAKTPSFSEPRAAPAAASR